MFNKKPLADTTTRRPSTGAQAKIYSRDNVARYSERARQRRRSHNVRRVALIAVLGVLLSATTAAGLWFATIMGKLGDSNVITENIFENRFMFASELVRMGADIRIESHHAMIHGVKGFSGAQVTSPDLRGGAALVVAGLIADGTTEVSAIHHIKRGYEQFVEKLQALGAHVEHATVPDPVIY